MISRYYFIIVTNEQLKTEDSLIEFIVVEFFRGF